MREQTNFPSEIAEAALAHSVGDKVIAAYVRTTFFERRRKLCRRGRNSPPRYLPTWCRCAMSKDRRIDLLVKIVLSEARSGNLLPLIARVASGRLTAPEREFIIDFLERHQDKRRAKAELRTIEQDLIRLRVEELIRAGF